MSSHPLAQRNQLAALAATVVVAAVAIAGFLNLGSPGTQRLIQSDQRTLQAVSQLAQQINNVWRERSQTLPRDLSRFPETETTDPVSHRPFLYRPTAGSAYQLCATFAADTKDLKDQTENFAWHHPRGFFCFQLDAEHQLPPARFVY